MVDHNHHQCGCKHLLCHCDHCDVVYCTKCKKEWKTYTSSWQWKYINPQVFTTWDNNSLQSTLTSTDVKMMAQRECQHD